MINVENKTYIVLMAENKKKRNWKNKAWEITLVVFMLETRPRE